MSTESNTCINCDKPTTNKLFCNDCLATEQSTCPCGKPVAGPGAYCSTSCVRKHGPARPVVKAEPETEAFIAEVYASDDDDEDDDSMAEILGDYPLVPSTSSPKPLYAELRHVTHDTSKMCACCSSLARGTCRCGRRVCGGCVDAETGLCAYCEDVVVDGATVIEMSVEM